MDVQNALAYKLEGPAFIDVVRDAEGNPIVDPNNTTQYLTKFLDNTQGIVQPGIGIIVDF
jgi:hypothetical protein